MRVKIVLHSMRVEKMTKNGDTIKSGSNKKVPQEKVKRQHPKPFIPKRAPAEKSVYSATDYDEFGKIKTLRKVPDGPKLQERRSTVLGSTNTSKYAAAAERSVQRQMNMAEEEPLDEGLAKVAVKMDNLRKTEQSDAALHKPTPLEDRKDIMPEPAIKHRLDQGKYDVETPEKLRSPHQSQYIAVIRSIENRHPDEDRILQHYYLQYVARKEGTYNPIDDPPVVLSDLLPTVCVVIDRVFSFDDVQGDGLSRLKKYVKQIATHTDMDVIPVTMNKAFHLPLHPSTAFKYKHKLVDQIMHEWHESHQESASDILSRIERDREGKPAQKSPWHIYDGVSEQGAFGPQTRIATLEQPDNEPNQIEPSKKMSWAEQTEAEQDEDDIESGDEWTTVKKGKQKVKNNRK